MITKEEAREIAIKYLTQKKTTFLTVAPISQISLEKSELGYGIRPGQIFDLYSVPFDIPWGLDVAYAFVIMNANNGDVFYVLGPHGLWE